LSLRIWGIVAEDRGYIEPVDKEARNLLGLFVTTMKIPRALDIIGIETLRESPIIQLIRRIRNELLEHILSEFSSEQF